MKKYCWQRRPYIIFWCLWYLKSFSLCPSKLAADIGMGVQNLSNTWDSFHCWKAVLLVFLHVDRQFNVKCEWNCHPNQFWEKPSDVPPLAWISRLMDWLLIFKVLKFWKSNGIKIITMWMILISHFQSGRCGRMIWDSVNIFWRLFVWYWT